MEFAFEYSLAVCRWKLVPELQLVYYVLLLIVKVGLSSSYTTKTVSFETVSYHTERFYGSYEKNGYIFRKRL